MSIYSITLIDRLHVTEVGMNLFNNNPLKQAVVPLPAQTALLSSNGSPIMNGRWVPNRRN